ncbi:MAG: type II toxin-antitoxin system Phd/YefM family antitoxin [Spirochaetes bacterium]|nr:MAG: type II toxin-antitoxin system Phd/YefM family antitoxin [Spirochaetota bacterium]RKX86567.1 MAG: type II toxin-antitoxin system Phd/YefM family antitoxin [Spirochaetota bacterium]RKX97276.1 MAG: type II toxin-antitoxin system Phd/YefM family antitoxin [Spirochaetota bacterium]
MIFTATKLRQNLYNILDGVIDSGIPVEIERKGVLLKIVPEKTMDKWDRLEEHHVINGNPESIVSVDWSEEWNNGDDL